MNDREMRYMIGIAEAGSIQKAAVFLEKDASSLSRTVKRIEDRLEITLFKRTPSGLISTPEGEVYLIAAREMLELYDNISRKD